MGSADSNNAPKAANDQSEADFLRMFGETSPSRLDRQKKIAAALNLDEQKDDLDEINEEDFAKQTEIKVAVDQTPCPPTDAFQVSSREACPSGRKGRGRKKQKQ